MIEVKDKDDQVIQFLSALYDDEDMIYLRRFDDKKRDGYLPKNMEYKLRDLKPVLDDLRRLNQDGYGLYYVVNGGGHSDKDVKVARCQFVECDDLSLEEQYKQIDAFPLKPSFLIQTRKSVHCYWKIEEGSIKRFRGIQIKLAKYFNGDIKCQNESRVMRLPTFDHNKAEPVEVKLITFNPERVYTQDEIEELLPEVEAVKAKAQSRFMLPDSIEDGHRQNTLMRYASQLWQKGYSKNECKEKVKTANQERCSHPLPEEQLIREVFPVFDRYEQGNFLDRFHSFNKNGQPSGVYDDYICDYIKAHNNLFVMNTKPYFYCGGVYRLDEKGIVTKGAIKDLMYPAIVNVNRIERVYKLLITDADLQMTIDDVNQYPDYIINFRNGMYNAMTGAIKEHKPDYYSINQIPHDYKRKCKDTKSTSSRFIEGLIPDQDDRRMFYQYAGYMFTKGTWMQKFLILEGKGDTGKSTIIRLLSKAIGKENISNLKLQQLNERFCTTALIGKLANLCADIPSTVMEQVDQIKMITGEDDIFAEYKGVDGFFFRSYAKLFFSANKMPRTHEDESGAYYRRLLIIKINGKGENIPDLESKLANEVELFISDCMDALNDLYLNGFAESDHSKEAVSDLRKTSDTVEAFLEDVCIRDIDEQTVRSELHRSYLLYCEYTGRQPKLQHNFYSTLKSKGFIVDTVSKIDGKNARTVKGISVDQDKLYAFNDHANTNSNCDSELSFIKDAKI